MDDCGVRKVYQSVTSVIIVLALTVEESGELHVRPQNRKLVTGGTLAAASLLRSSADRAGAVVLHAGSRVSAPDASGFRRRRYRCRIGDARHARSGAAGEPRHDGRG